MATGHTALFEVALVVFLRWVELAGGSDFGCDRLAVPLAGLKIGFGLFGDGFLLWRVSENGRTVLLAKVRSLAIDLSGIVHVPEGVDERFVFDFGWIKGDLDDFGMTGLVGADIFVRRIFGVAVAVADDGILYALNHTEFHFDAPETASGKRCEFSHWDSLPVVIASVTRF
jgi:hypothetical protein